MNSKEALKEMLDLTTPYYDYWVKANDYYKAILKDLDKLEQMEQNHEVVLQTLESVAQENIKLQKVIEILKNKQVHIVILLECIKANGGVELYNACVEKPYQLTQEEYDLLKKVFGNE